MNQAAPEPTPAPLYRCLDCGREGFTSHKGHNCGGQMRYQDLHFEPMTQSPQRQVVTIIEATPMKPASFVGTSPDPTDAWDVALHTLEARANRIRNYDAAVKNGFRSQMCYAFLSGIELLAAKKELPHGHFGDWQKEQFPGISPRSIANYMAFSDALQTKFATVANLITRLQIGPGEALSEVDQSTVMEAVHEAADGKTLTEFYRDLGVIRAPKPKEFHPPQLTPEEEAASLEQQADEHAITFLGDARLLMEMPTKGRLTDARKWEIIDMAVTLSKDFREDLKDRKRKRAKATKPKPRTQRKKANSQK